MSHGDACREAAEHGHKVAPMARRKAISSQLKANVSSGMLIWTTSVDTRDLASWVANMSPAKEHAHNAKGQGRLVHVNSPRSSGETEHGATLQVGSSATNGALRDGQCGSLCFSTMVNLGVAVAACLWIHI